MICVKRSHPPATAATMIAAYRFNRTTNGLHPQIGHIVVSSIAIMFGQQGHLRNFIGNLAE